MIVTEIDTAANEALLMQIDRILRSEEFRGSEVLRRLLKFLAEKSVSGEADDLKEYVIAIDGLSKPATYDPRHNSAVRIQVGRLRQKLADYYRSEGHCDPILIDLPKGRFKLKFEPRPCPALNVSVPEAFPESLASTEASPAGETQSGNTGKKLRIFHPAIPPWVMLILVLSFLGYRSLRPSTAKANSQVPDPPGWNADVEAIWHPFVDTDRPLIMAVEDPLFVELNGSTGIYYRDRTLNTWNDIVSSPNVAALRKSLRAPVIQPSRYYTAFGEVDTSFLIGKLLGPRVANFSVVKTSDLSLREIGDNNVVFAGVQNIFFNEQTQAMPVEVQFVQVREGIRNRKPGPNEPALFLDHYSTAPTEEGHAFALVTHLPGPIGDNDVESFTSSRAAGYVAAVKAFTDPDVLHSIVTQLKRSCGGHMPRYYQVLLRVRFRQEVPTEITYVLGRELH